MRSSPCSSRTGTSGWRSPRPVAARDTIGRGCWPRPAPSSGKEGAMPPLEIDPRVLGQRIAESRKARGKTQEEVAEFLGCSRPTYIAIEKGDRAAKPEEI